MIDEKKIEETAKEYSKVTDCNKTEAMLVEEGFKEGAHWAIEQFLKDLWHPASEEPKKGKLCLLEVIYSLPLSMTDEIDYITSKSKKYGWEEYNFKRNDREITRWLYVDDLLPK